MNDNIMANKLIYHLDRLVLDRRPITADVFLTNFCNNACHYCNYAKHKSIDREKRYVKIDDFIRNVERLVNFGVNGIILTGGGEPTINPDFDKITQFLEINAIEYGVNTNFVEYKQMRPSFLKVSLDAHDKESYLEMRGVDMFDSVIANVKRYIRWKRDNSVGTNVGLQMLVTNPENILKFYEAHKDILFDYMVFRPYESRNSSYYSGGKIEDIEKSVKIIKSIAEKDNRIIANYKWNHLFNGFQQCYGHWTQMAVNESSEILFCCHKPQEVICKLHDSNAFNKWKQAKTDISTCDIPCRLSGINDFIRKIEHCPSNVNFI